MDSEAVLLLENDEDIVSDVRYAVSSLGVELVAVRSLPEAMAAIASAVPTIILMGIGTVADPYEAASELRDAAQDSRLMVVGLARKKASITLQGPQGFLSDVLNVPVKFPVFAEKLEELMSQAAVQRALAGL